MSIIFLAGVHGVGKGYLGSRVAEALGIFHCTASQLIRDEKDRMTWSDDKRAGEVLDNQLALIRAVERLRVSRSIVLLDGHFALWNSSGKVTKLPTSIFSDLLLKGVLLICDSPLTVSARLLSRDGVATPPDQIAELAYAEREHAHDVCGELQIPLLIIDSPDEAMVTSAIKSLLAVT